MNEKLKNLLRLFLPLIIGGIVSLFLLDKIDYENLISPPLAPPQIVFPIVWSIIYILMGISYYKLTTHCNPTAIEKGIYYVQLSVNALWSIIFFVLKWRLFACIWIILLDILVIAMIITFYKKCKESAYLNIPYLIWILFATYLTIGFYTLNPL